MITFIKVFLLATFLKLLLVTLIFNCRNRTVNGATELEPEPEIPEHLYVYGAGYKNANGIYTQDPSESENAREIIFSKESKEGKIFIWRGGLDDRWILGQTNKHWYEITTSSPTGQWNRAAERLDPNDYINYSFGFPPIVTRDRDEYEEHKNQDLFDEDVYVYSLRKSIESGRYNIQDKYQNGAPVFRHQSGAEVMYYHRSKNDLRADSVIDDFETVHGVFMGFRFTEIVIRPDGWIIKPHCADLHDKTETFPAYGDGDHRPISFMSEKRINRDDLFFRRDRTQQQLTVIPGSVWNTYTARLKLYLSRVCQDMISNGTVQANHLADDLIDLIAGNMDEQLQKTMKDFDARERLLPHLRRGGIHSETADARKTAEVENLSDVKKLAAVDVPTIHKFAIGDKVRFFNLTSEKGESLNGTEGVVTKTIMKNGRLGVRPCNGAASISVKPENIKII